jgi:Tfp pilus assembly protein PilF
VARRADGGPFGLANSLNHLGRALADRDRIAEALPHLEEALALCSHERAAFARPLTLENPGICALRQGHAEEALGRLEAAREIGDRIHEAEALRWLALAHEHGGTRTARVRCGWRRWR